MNFQLSFPTISPDSTLQEDIEAQNTTIERKGRK